MTKKIVVQKITREMLKKQFLEDRITKSLDNKLLKDKIQENNQYIYKLTNITSFFFNYRCKSILKIY